MELEGGTYVSKYRIETLLGRGGMGEVYRARDETLGRSVALKIIRRDLPLDEGRVRRFTDEARLASSLNHPHLAHVYDVGESAGRHFIAMEYVDGGTFRAATGANVSLAGLLRYLTQVGEALAKAHEAGIVHRDLKPDNILISSDGYAKVVDFGLAKLIEGRSPNESLTADGAIVGTVGYMAPEQVRGEHADQRSDIFAFGCVLHEAITRTRTFAAKTAFETMNQIVNGQPAPLPDSAGGELQRIVDGCLAKRPEARYQTMREVVRDLRKVLLAMESDASAPTQQLQSRPSQTLPRRRLLILALVVLVLAAIAAVAPRVISRRPREPVPVINAEDAWLRAKVVLADERRENADKAIAILRPVIEAHPRYAPAYAALGRAYSIKSFYYARGGDQAQLEEDGKVFVEKALALDPRLAEAHVVQARLLWTPSNRFPHELAMRALRQAIALDPRSDEAHHLLAVILFHVGLFDEAEKELNLALAANPSNSLARFRFGVIAMYRGQYDEALNWFRSTPLKKNPSLWAFQTATALFRLHRVDEAKTLLDEFLQKYPDDEGGVGTSVRAMMLASSGQRAQAEGAIRDAIRLGEGFGHFHHTAYNIASAYALLGNNSEAEKWLEVAADDGFPCYPLFAGDSHLDSLRNDRRLITLLGRLKTQMERYAQDSR